MFELTPQQQETATQWIRTHDCPRRREYAGAIGGVSSYCFTPTSIGEIAVVKCWCGQELNLTDFSDW